MRRAVLASIRAVVALAVVFLLATGLPHTAYGSARCSLSADFLRALGETPFFLGRPLPDTVLAGPGTISTQGSQGPGHFGPGRARPIYGQRVAIERLGRVAREQLPAGAQEVVLVPWDYGPSCDPLPWSQSARWLSDADTGVFVGGLRAPEHWAAGLPTFDIGAPQFAYYPEAFDRSIPGRRGVRRVSASEFLAIIDDSLASLDGADSIFALAAARHWWLRGGRDDVYPYRELVSRATDVVRGAREKRIVTPVAGLYRVRLRWSGSTERAIFLRITETVATSVLQWPDAQDENEFRMPETMRYYLHAFAADSVATLPSVCRYDQRTVEMLHRVGVQYHARRNPRTLRVRLDQSIVASAMTPSESTQWYAATSARTRRHWAAFRLRNDSLRAAGEPPEDPVFPEQALSITFTRSRLGKVTLQGTPEDPVLGPITVRAERLDDSRVACERNTTGVP